MSNEDYSDLPSLSLRYMVEDYEKLIKMGPPARDKGSDAEQATDHRHIEKQAKRSA